MKKNINGVRNLFGAAPQNQGGNVELWEKGGGGRKAVRMTKMKSI